MSNTHSPRILITRLSAIGDCIATLPLLCDLRRAHPEAFLAWVVEPAAAVLLEDHAMLDRLVVIPKRWWKSAAGILRVRRALRALRCEVALDPQSLTKSSLAAWLSGASLRIGFASPRGRELAPWLNNHRVPARQEHLVDCQRELLAPLGIVPGAVEFHLPAPATARETARAVIRDTHLGGGFAVINPGAGWESRRWSSERFGKVARHLGERWNLPSLVSWAGDAERRAGEEIVGGSGGHALLAPATSLPELAALLRQARLYVGCDTGPMHIAAAVGTTCVALFGPTRWQCSGAYGPQHVPVQACYDNRRGRRRAGAGNSAMEAITVEAVTQACDRALGAGQVQRRAG